MPKSSSVNRQKKSSKSNKKSRGAIEQEALEGRGRDIYKYLMEYNLTNYVDETLLYLSFLWLYCDPKRELNVEQFMDMTEPEMHKRFDNLKTKNHLIKLKTFEEVIRLYSLENGEVEVPYRYAI